MRSKTAVLVLALASAACGDRPDEWEAPTIKSGALRSFGLADQVAVVDEGAHRVALLSARAGQELSRSSVRVGKNVTVAAPSADTKRLFVLSAGELPRRKGTDERPSLSVIEGGALKTYPLESPHTGLAVDPLGKWCAVFAAPGSGPQTNFVENPNEIILIDLEAPLDSAVIPRTLRSFGGKPQRVSFTPTLSLPGGPRRLMIVETDQDVVLLDVDRVKDKPERPEITVRLTSGTSAQSLRPGGVVVDDGGPANDDARIGVRLTNDNNVVVLTLGPGDPGAPNDFRPSVNLTDVGGVASDLSFVRTDLGLRLAALVPAQRSAVLIDPATSITTKVDLPAGYGRISLITNAVGADGKADVALLYAGGGSSASSTSGGVPAPSSGSGAGVAFWSLGRTDQLYRSVEVLSLDGGVTSVLDVPAPRAELKVLRTGSTFYVLNLATRTAAPLTTLGNPNIVVSPDAQRLWVYRGGAGDLSQVTLDTLHPVQLPTERSLSAVHEVARADGGRALIALDARGGVAATVLDALAPDTAQARTYFGLLVEGMQ
jgi:hypothetical protein